MNASSPTSSGKSAIVFALDEKFASLGKGLVLSLRTLGLPDDSADLCLIDIGCGQETQQWMTGQGCVVARFDASLISVPPPADSFVSGARMLWDRGNYLSEKEIAELKQTRHY